MLKARKKITKREIKEDPLVTAYVRVQKFLQNHGKTINIILVAVILLSVYIIFDSKNKKDNARRAEKEIVLAEQIYFSKDYERAINALLAFTEQFKGTPAAGRAVFFIANAYYEKENYSEARQYYQQYVDNYGQIGYFNHSSLAGIAACLENEKQFEKAAVMYEKASKSADDSYSVPFYLKNAARCYVLSDQKEKAKSIYQRLMDAYPDAPISEEVAFLLESLKAS
ncbi:tetratricopeptide repeat protein [bacterium]|nr:tetratricopeptide repeat protein [bacterium]